MNPHIFKEYDIRGIVDPDLPDDLVVKIGKACGTELIRAGKKTFNIGRDCRLTSDRMFEKLSEGILSTGCHIKNIGLSTSPMLYFSIFNYDADGGIMITGSHNDKEYNGFKISIGKDSLYGDRIQELKRKIEANDFETGSGSTEDWNITDDYIEFITKAVEVKKPLKVVVDAGNGTGGHFSVPILKKLGCDITELYCEMDGNFPNHHPDPTVPENLQDLIKKVLEVNADVGIAYDGDTDRIGVVDEKGGIIFGDYLMILFAKEILSRKPNSIFISEVKCSKNMYREIERMGGKPIMWKTGHSLIKAKMKETNAELAGELSGHIFFKDRYFGFDDAIYATCRLLEILGRSNQTLSEMLAYLPKTYSTPEIHVDCPDGKKFKVVERAVTYFKEQNYPVIEVDGARVTIDESWGLVRASNTSPVLVLRFESENEAKLQEIKNSFLQKVEELIGEVE